ncbi:GDYXXLXY domain-containing protein [Roseibium sp. SCP14]|uniref:GDYXXLXY domain-containing protein n=1 Tax=Roseibium sp. SCP14 TaxID=3141375 RepID=UPI00333BFA49
MNTSTDAIGLDRKSVAGTAYLKWGILALVQLLLVSIPLVDRLQVQMNGIVVPMELVPVDPRDLLRGDYVIINLAISRVSKDVPGSETVEAGDPVYVGLISEGKGPVRPHTVSRLREGAGELAIAGTVRTVADEFIQVDYGIDAFFLPEGEGLAIERMDKSRVLLEVAIDEDGQSLPVTLLVDGKAFKSDGTF